MSANLKKSDSNFTTNEKGQSRYAKGNTIGRMKKKGFTLTDLNKLVAEVEKTKSKALLRHYIERLFENDRLLENYVEKNVPTKSLADINLSGNLTIEKVDYTRGLDDNSDKNKTTA